MSHDYNQLFAENGTLLPDKIPVDVVKADKLLHGATHVWIWRRTGEDKQILLQCRSINVPWPGYLDISTAGHINLNENPIDTAIREAYEEIGLTINRDDLQLVGIHRCHIPVPDTDLEENEFRWVYLLELDQDYQFSLNDNEVESIEWVDLSKFVTMTDFPEKYKLVPQGSDYFAMLLRWLV